IFFILLFARDLAPFRIDLDGGASRFFKPWWIDPTGRRGIAFVGVIRDAVLAGVIGKHPQVVAPFANAFGIQASGFYVRQIVALSRMEFLEQLLDCSQLASVLLQIRIIRRIGIALAALAFAAAGIPIAVLQLEATMLVAVFVDFIVDPEAV